jgi:TPP-dependent pyruvate/acetoin dehydrogenase alpha subunit
MFDPELYRDKNEVQNWKKKDPLQFLKHHLLEQVEVSQAELSNLDALVEEEMSEAVAFAEEGTEEPVEDLEKYLYADDLPRSP